jgi:beta-alanine--pyruvate transaminase
MAVGGITANKKVFGPGLAGVDHIRHTHDPARNSFSKGQPKHGAEFADELERLCLRHDPSTIAALIVEPVAGSAGVLVPPVGYLERLREICTRHGILLIFDEVITGFGRLGKPFGSQHFGVMPDLFTTAKALTNATVPMGAVFVKNEIFDAFMQGGEGIELFHGYTYSGHPVACAAGIATLDVFEEEGLLTRAASVAKHWEDRAHALKGAPHVVDVRNCGLMAAIELEPRAGQPGKRAYEVFVRAFEAGVLIRVTGDTIALSPPLIVEQGQIDRIFDCVGAMLRAVS